MTTSLRSVHRICASLRSFRLSTNATALTCPLPRHSYLCRSFATGGKPLPTLANLDNIQLTWQTPAILSESGDSKKVSRRVAAAERAKQKSVNGQRRREERAARVEKAREAAKRDDFRGLDPNTANLYSSALPVLSELDAPDHQYAESLGSLKTASAKELFSGRVRAIREQFGRTLNDTGSSEVQVSILSDRINTLQHHTGIRHSDQQARKRLYTLRSRRRKLLKYLRRTNFVSFEVLMRKWSIPPNEVDGEGWTEKSGNQARRPARSG